MNISFDEFEFDPTRLELRRAGTPLKVDALVLRTLGALVQRAGQLVTREEIVDIVWQGRAVTDNSITVAMAKLRRCLGRDREYVVNVRGLGYRFVQPVTVLPSSTSQSAEQTVRNPVGSPFVGRTQILGELRSALHAACAGNGRLCILTGEPGIGKTRVAEQFATETSAAGVPVAWGYCHEVGDMPPLWPFAQLLRQRFVSVNRAELRGRMRQQWAELEALMPGVLNPENPGENPASESAALTNATQSSAKHRVFDAIVRALSLSAKSSPYVLVLDDFHRADEDSQELLRYLVEELSGMAILVVATARNLPQPPAHIAHILGHRNTTCLPIGPLSEEQVQEYVQTLLPDSGASVAPLLYTKSEGNPFFMRELARQLLEPGRGPETQIALPDAALELMRQRVALLSDSDQQTLAKAASIGRNFTLPMLQVVTQQDAEQLMSCLDNALAYDLVTHAADSSTSFSFSHGLIQSVLYGALAPAERRRCHLRIAEALEQRVFAGQKVSDATLAHHYHSALPNSDLRKTVRYCIEAAIAASNTCAYKEADRYVQYALEALNLLHDPSPRMRLRLMFLRAAFTRPHSRQTFEALANEVVHIARERGAAEPLAHVVLLLDPYRGFPPLPDCRRTAEDALALLPQGDEGNRACILARLATFPPTSFNRQDCRTQLDEAAALAERSDFPLAHYSVKLAELYLFGGVADRDYAEQVLADLDAMCQTNLQFFGAQPVLLQLHRVISALQDGDLEGAERELERCSAHCRAVNSDMSWHVDRCRALTGIQTGNSTDGRAALRALHGRKAPDPPAAFELFAAHDVWVVLQEGSYSKHHELCTVVATNGDDPPNIWALKVRVLCAAGLHELARKALHSVPASALADLPYDRDYLGTLGSLTRSAIVLEEQEYLEALYPLLRPYRDRFAINIAFHCEGSIAELMGLISGALGRDNDAMVELEEGVRQCQSVGFETCAAVAEEELSRYSTATVVPEASSS